MREKSLDIAKGIGILLVIAGHTYNIPEVARRIIYAFHMPLFFIIAGYLYNEAKYNQYGLIQIIEDKAQKYLFPYYIFACINLIITSFWNVYLYGIDIAKSKMPEYIYSILLGFADEINMPNCAPIWFLMCLFISSVMFWVILKDKKNNLYFLIPALVLICFLLSLLNIKLPWNLSTSFLAVAFMIMGHIFKQKEITYKFKKKNIVLIILGIVCAVLNTENIGMNENIYGNILLFFVSGTVLSYGILVLCCKLQKYNFGLLTWLGKNTLIVIGFNYFMRVFSTEIYYLVPTVRDYPINWEISFVITTIGLMVMILVWNKLKTFLVNNLGKNVNQ